RYHRAGALARNTTPSNTSTPGTTADNAPRTEGVLLAWASVRATLAAAGGTLSGVALVIAWEPRPGASAVMASLPGWPEEAAAALSGEPTVPSSGISRIRGWPAR